MVLVCNDNMMSLAITFDLNIGYLRRKYGKL